MSKIALITGGNRGLGLETARQLGNLGHKVVVGSRDLAKGDEAAAMLRSERIDAEALAMDVNSVASVKSAATQFGERHDHLDVLVNNAGILPEATADERPEIVDFDLFTQTFATNVLGPVAVTQEFLPLLRASDAGRIVNVSTTMGSLSEQFNPQSPYFGLVVPAYQGSKAALNALTIALSKSLEGSSMKVNSVCPGWLQTDLGGPDNRAAAPLSAAEGAGIVVEMACLDGGGPTGTFVDRDGEVPW